MDDLQRKAADTARALVRRDLTQNFSKREFLTEDAELRLTFNLLVGVSCRSDKGIQDLEARAIKIKDTSKNGESTGQIRRGDKDKTKRWLHTQYQIDQK